ncbi:hypothetical protein C9J85_10905 [Haloferax sp. wsp5]|nr:hypothetical protein C9J85_10905 [Haloferax sp. wsp5]
MARRLLANEGSLSWPMVMQASSRSGPSPAFLPAIVGTVWLVVGATLFAVPLGVGAAVFLTEYAERAFTALVEIATNALWSTPSIVFGLFGAAFLIPRLGGDESLLAGMLVLGFSSAAGAYHLAGVDLAVPDEYRDASAALGVTQWQTVGASSCRRRCRASSPASSSASAASPARLLRSFSSSGRR